MKRIVTLFVLFFLGVSLYGQTQEAISEIEMFSNVLNIQEHQKNRLVEIVNRKYIDLEIISGNRSSDENLYREKRRNIYQGVHNSIRLMINEEQFDLWTNFIKKERLKNAKLIKDLNTINASKDDLMDAQFGIIN